MIVGVCGPGDFLGEMSFLTGKPASATVRVANETRCCVFDPGVLKVLIEKNPAIRQTLEYSFNRNLVGKLERMNEANREANEAPAPAEDDAGPAEAAPSPGRRDIDRSGACGPERLISHVAASCRSDTVDLQRRGGRSTSRCCSAANSDCVPAAALS